jgi:hypothetical protein
VDEGVPATTEVGALRSGPVMGVSVYRRVDPRVAAARQERTQRWQEKMRAARAARRQQQMRRMASGYSLVRRYPYHWRDSA